MYELNERRLKFGEFILKNKIFWQRSVTFLVFFITLGVSVLFAISWIVFISGTLNDTSLYYNLTTEHIPYAVLREKLQPLPLSITSVDVVPTGALKADLVATIHNPNPDWYAQSIEYRFVVNSEPQAVASTFLHPRAQQYILAYNVSIQPVQTPVRVDVVHVVWKRLRNENMLSELKQISVSQIAFNNSPLLDTFTASGVIHNNSKVNFWIVGVQAVARRPTGVVGVNFITLERMRANSSRSVRFVWPSPLTGVTSVEIIPIIDILDPSVIMPFSSAPKPTDPSGID